MSLSQKSGLAVITPVKAEDLENIQDTLAILVARESNSDKDLIEWEKVRSNIYDTDYKKTELKGK